MKNKMNFTSPSLSLLILLFASYAFAKDPPVITLQGEIVDSQCAYNVHSLDHTHSSMVKKGVYGKDATTCTLHCVREMGGNFVLVVKEDVYRLDGSVQLEQFAGKKVKVSGVLDPKTQTLHIQKMEADR
jgi:type 1 fimbria pilin